MLNPKIAEILKNEEERQTNQLSLIASENYVSKDVLQASASPFTNKYAEGYPGKRYYGGNQFSDEIELEAIRLAQQVFETDYHLNVQPYSGSPANLEVYAAFLKPGDTALALSLSEGGHLTHGHDVNFSGKLYNFVHYGVSRETELIDMEQVHSLAKERQPSLIVCGATAYPAFIDFVAFAKVAREVGAWLMVDMSHFAGLVAGKVYPSPFGIADVITTTTHKTLRGPRAAMIFCKKEFAKAIDKAVFPGMQGGPHLQTIAAMAVCFSEALQPSFHQYAKQVVANAKALAYNLQQAGFRLVSDGTDSHLLLLDLGGTELLGEEAQKLLESIGLIVNKNAIPFDQQPPLNPSGLRLGTPAVTTRGMKEKEMERIAHLISEVLHHPRAALSFADEVKSLAKKFRIPAHF